MEGRELPDNVIQNSEEILVRVLVPDCPACFLKLFTVVQNSSNTRQEPQDMVGSHNIKSDECRIEK